MNDCSTCKHFVHLNNVAHQNRCAKFQEEGKDPPPIAAVRIIEGKCEGGKEWEG